MPGAGGSSAGGVHSTSERAMAASVKIEFDDGSRVISQTLEEAAGAGVTDARVGSSELSGDKRPSSCSIDAFYEVRDVGTYRRRLCRTPSLLPLDVGCIYTRHRSIN